MQIMILFWDIMKNVYLMGRQKGNNLNEEISVRKKRKKEWRKTH